MLKFKKNVTHGPFVEFQQGNPNFNFKKINEIFTSKKVNFNEKINYINHWEKTSLYIDENLIFLQPILWAFIKNYDIWNFYAIDKKTGDSILQAINFIEENINQMPYVQILKQLENQKLAKLLYDCEEEIEKLTRNKIEIINAVRELKTWLIENFKIADYFLILGM